MGNIVPLNLACVTSKETQTGKYSIPKGTLVIGSLTSVLFDESEWETPHSFNPGHFLDAEGKFRRRDAFLPFSLGKRRCPGEQLAFSLHVGVEPSFDYKVGNHWMSPTT
nr:cytochrome P450 2W1-like [Danio rerio]|eukprot:XP_021324301.1 cytochrome P450 2W1-like [Danio rerio]